jgi:preprotein translocase subunit YajC
VPVFFFQINQQAMTKTLTLILAQQTTPAAQAQGSSLLSLLPFVLLMVGLYFIMIAPQRKKQKELEKTISAIGTGDEVVTTGGIYGVIASVKSDRFTIRIADNTKIEVGKAFILSVVKKDGEEKSK